MTDAPARKVRGHRKVRGQVLMLVENRAAPADARVWPEAVALRDAGYRVTVISPKGKSDHQAPHEIVDGIDIFRYALRTGDGALAYLVEYGTALLATARLSLKVWRRGRFDVIHTANPPDIFFPLAWLYRLFGVRFVFDQHDLAPETFRSRFSGRLPSVLSGVLQGILDLCERLTYRAADLVIVTNESFRRVAVARGGCDPERVVVVRNGPDLERLRTAGDAIDLRNGQRYLLAYVGEMAAQDGVEYALRALNILVNDRGRSDVRLALIGDGTSRPALEELSHTLGLDEHITFTGWVPGSEVSRFLRAADIGLSPEPRNAMNDASTMIKVMEYMAAGMPIVAFDLTETRFSAQDAALYAVVNDTASFATRIEELLDDRQKRENMARAGRKRIEEHLSWAHSRAKLVAAYRELFREADHGMS